MTALSMLLLILGIAFVVLGTIFACAVFFIPGPYGGGGFKHSDALAGVVLAIVGIGLLIWAAV